jgi:propionate CoA-transferase
MLTQAISERFTQEQRPIGLTLLFASGAGDKKGNGLDKLATPGLTKRAIGGFWGFCPKLAQLGRKGEIEAHSWPMGVVSHLFRDMAAGLDGHLTYIGLHTFVDPRIEGGRMAEHISPAVEVVHVRGEEMLFYPSPGADFALLRGTIADQQGNISMEGEAALHDAIWQAMATRNNGGKIAIQVEHVVDSLPADKVHIPGHLIDFIVKSDVPHHPSYGTEINAADPYEPEMSVAKNVIVARACGEIIPDGAFLNFGIGVPASIGERLTSIEHHFHTSVESGVINGKPKEGIAFGEATGYSCIMQQSDLFSFYDGGGIDIAFLGFAEIDRHGNINASAFGERFTGAGGFINIAHSAKKIILCGTSNTNGLVMSQREEKSTIHKEGNTPKFVDKVQQITIATNSPHFWEKEIKIITERAVLLLFKGVFTLTELSDGLTVSDVLRVIPFPVNISKNILR